MRWDDFRQSDNLEDVRGGGGGGMGVPGGAGGLGIGTVVVLGLLGWALGIDPSLLIGGVETMTRNTPQYERREAPRTGRPTDDVGRFIGGVLGETEDRWKEIFRENNADYEAPRLVLFERQVQSACGFAQAAMGPFYCPSDRKVYLDTSFFRELQNRFRACTGRGCEFAQSYVIAHEIGHHVQNLLGVLPRVRRLQQASASKADSNRYQVMVELQADCFAGVWANREQKKKPHFLEPGDIDAALQTASAIGDDMLQRRSQGYVVPDSFTHGTSEQRKRWFMTGYREGKVSACNTFNAAQL
jgi:predicted metalloprotease